MFVVRAKDEEGNTEEFGVTDVKAENAAQAVKKVAQKIGGQYSNYESDVDEETLVNIEVIGTRDEDLTTI